MAYAMLSKILETLKSKNDTAVCFSVFELAKEQELIMWITSLLHKTEYHGFMYHLTFMMSSILEKKIFVTYDNGASIGKV